MAHTQQIYGTQRNAAIITIPSPCFLHLPYAGTDDLPSPPAAQTWSHTVRQSTSAPWTTPTRTVRIQHLQEENPAVSGVLTAEGAEMSSYTFRTKAVAGDRASPHWDNDDRNRPGTMMASDAAEAKHEERDPATRPIKSVGEEPGEGREQGAKRSAVQDPCPSTYQLAGWMWWRTGNQADALRRRQGGRRDGRRRDQ